MPGLDESSVRAPDVDVTAQPAAASDAPPAAATDTPTPVPNLRRLGRAVERQVAVRSIAITGLFLFATFYTLYFARAFFLPIVSALLLDFLLSPGIRAMARARIPTAVGAVVIVALLLGTLSFVVTQLAPPAAAWIDRAPLSMANVAEKLRRLRRPVEQVTKTAEQVAQATGASSGPRAGEVTVRGPSLSARVVDTATSLAFGLIETIILLYFLLAAGDLFLQKLIKVLPQLRDKKKAVQIAREIETSVSTYLSTITLVNFGEAIVVSLAMWAVGMPNPVLWGVLAGVAEFIPYLGAATMTAVLGFAALTTFDNIFHALLIPATYFAINFVQANFVTPVVLGRRLTLNPVAIFIGLLFWWRLWGIPGAFIAVPLIATFKIFCDHIEALAPVGEFLGK